MAKFFQNSAGKILLLPNSNKIMYDDECCCFHEGYCLLIKYSGSDKDLKGTACADPQSPSTVGGELCLGFVKWSNQDDSSSVLPKNIIYIKAISSCVNPVEFVVFDPHHKKTNQQPTISDTPNTTPTEEDPIDFATKISPYYIDGHLADYRRYFFFDFYNSARFPVFEKCEDASAYLSAGIESQGTPVLASRNLVAAYYTFSNLPWKAPIDYFTYEFKATVNTTWAIDFAITTLCCHCPPWPAPSCPTYTGGQDAHIIGERYMCVGSGVKSCHEFYPDIYIENSTSWTEQSSCCEDEQGGECFNCSPSYTARLDPLFNQYTYMPAEFLSRDVVYRQRTGNVIQDSFTHTFPFYVYYACAPHCVDNMSAWDNFCGGQDWPVSPNLEIDLHVKETDLTGTGYTMYPDFSSPQTSEDAGTIPVNDDGERCGDGCTTLGYCGGALIWSYSSVLSFPGATLQRAVNITDSGDMVLFSSNAVWTSKEGTVGFRIHEINNVDFVE